MTDAKVIGPTLDYLKDRHLWNGWMLVDGDKLPLAPMSKGAAKSNDPNTWGTRAAAQVRIDAELRKRNGADHDEPMSVADDIDGDSAAADREEWSAGSQHGGNGINSNSVNGETNGADGGVGINLASLGDGTHIGGIDLDSCRNPETGALTQWARQIIERFSTYAEISPSGTGVKVYITYDEAEAERLKVPISKIFRPKGERAKHGPAIEFYRNTRYFAVTDRQISNTNVLRLVSQDDFDWLLNFGSDFARGTLDATHEPTLDEVRAAILLLSADSYDQWIKFGLALKRTFGDAAFQLWDEWSRTSGAYKVGETEKKWRGFDVSDRANSVTAHYILNMAYGERDVQALNSEYAVIVVGNKLAILREGVSAKGKREFKLWTLGTFRGWFADRTIIINGKPRSLAQYWFTKPARRKYLGLVFDPSGRPTPGYYNIWRGFTVEPHPGDCSLLLDHLRDNVCQKDKQLYTWLVAWFADIFQHPDKKMGTSVVLRGKMGVGKTIVGKIIGSLLGDHYVQVASRRYVIGQFNSHLIQCLLFHSDEAFWAGDKQVEGQLRDLVTGDRHFIEFKGAEPIPVDNYVRFMATGNPDWLIPAGMDERRFAVFDVGDEHEKDTAYFAAIEKQMDNGGREALLHHLLYLDISKVNLRQIPKTAALLDQKLESLSPEDKFMLDVLQRGYLPGDSKGEGFVLTARLFDDYARHVHAGGTRHTKTDVQFGMWLRSNNAYKEVVEKKRQSDGNRLNYYQFAELTKCRARFEQRLQQPFKWDEPEAEWSKAPPAYYDAPY